MWSSGTMPSSADWITSCGAAETTRTRSGAVEIRQQLRKQPDILLQADAFSGLNQMLFPHAAILWIVQQQIGEFPALLHQVDL